MTNLDSIFKSRDISLLKKFSIIKAMIFPVVMYGSDSCTIRSGVEVEAPNLWPPDVKS